jgi:type III secretion protein C
MSIPTRSAWIARLALSFSIVAVLAGVAAQAAPMPNAARKVSITARELPIGAFLQNLFAQVGVPVVVSQSVSGLAVNGSFAAPAEQVLRDIARIYNLVPYFDGAVMHIVPAAELVQRTLPAGPAAAEKIARAVDELGLTDQRNTLRRTSDGNVIAAGVPRFVTQVEELLRAGQAQQNAKPTSNTSDFRVFYLRYASAQDMTITMGGRRVVLPGVATTLRSLVGAQTTQPIGQEVQLRPSVPGLRGQGLGGQGLPQRQLSDDDSGSRNDPRNKQVDALIDALQRTAQSQPQQAPAQQTVIPPSDPRQIRIEADARLNAVIVRDVAERLPRYESLIAALDVEPQPLEVEATIIDVNTDRARELGINWRLNTGKHELGIRNGSDTPLLGAGGQISLAFNAARQFLARISALEAEGAARVVSSPQVVTLSNVEAVFNTSSTAHVRIAGRNEVDLFPVTAGTTLRVTPRVSRGESRTQIMLHVHVEDGTFSRDRVVDQIPVVENSTLNTQALITEGESVLIGGMVRESTSNGVDKIPLLGDVPIVGNLFKNQRNATSRVERMFLITPRLAGSRSATPTTVAAAPLVPVSAPAAPAVAIAPAPRASKVLDLDTMGSTTRVNAQ